MLGKHMDAEPHLCLVTLSFIIGPFHLGDALKVHHAVEAWVSASFLFTDG